MSTMQLKTSTTKILRVDLYVLALRRIETLVVVVVEADLEEPLMEDFLVETLIMTVENLIIAAIENVVEVEMHVSTAVIPGTSLANVLSRQVVEEVREMGEVAVEEVPAAIIAGRRVIFLENVLKKEIQETEEAVTEVLEGNDEEIPAAAEEEVVVVTRAIIVESPAISQGNVPVTKEALAVVVAIEVVRREKAAAAEEEVVTPAIIAEKLATSLGNVQPEEKAVGIIKATLLVS